MKKCLRLLIPIMNPGETYGEVLNNPAKDDSRKRGNISVLCKKQKPSSSDLEKDLLLKFTARGFFCSQMGDIPTLDPH